MTDSTFTHRGVTYRTVKQSHPPAAPACVHRGDVAETLKLSCCGGINVRSCAIHGTCVDSRDDWDTVRGVMAREGRTCGAKCCAGCADRTSVALTHTSDQSPQQSATDPEASNARTSSA